MVSSPELWQAIGRVVVETARLEMSLATLAASLSPKGYQDAWIEEGDFDFRRLLKSIKQAAGTALKGQRLAEVQGLVSKAHTIYTERNDIVHSTYAWDLNKTPPGIARLRYRGKLDFVPVTPIEIVGLSDRVRELTQAVDRFLDPNM